MADILLEKNLRWVSHVHMKENRRWLGYVHRMEDSWLPKKLLYSQLKDGKRNKVRPRLRLKDVARRNMKRRSINLGSWKQTTDNKVA